MVRRLALPVLHVLLTLVAARVAAAPPQWLPPRSVTLGAEAGRVAGLDMCARGSEVMIAWSDARLGGRRLFWRRSLDSGATWQPEALVTSATPGASSPSLACDDDRLYLTWIHGGESDGALMYSSFGPGGWTPAIEVAPDALASSPAIAVTRAFPHAIGIAYEEIGEAGARATVTLSEDGGTTWSDPFPASQSGAPSARPAIAAAGEMFYLAWQDFRETSAHVYFTTRGPRLVGTERRLSQIGGAGSPSLDARERRVVAAWESKPGLDGPNIYATVSENEGFDWDLPTALTQSAPQSAKPAALALSDAAYVAWQDGAEGAFEVFLTQHAGGGLWRSPDRFTQSGSASIRPQLAASFPSGATFREANAQLQLAWIEREVDGAGVGAHSVRDTHPPDRPSAPQHVDVSARPGWDDDAEARFRWELDPSAAAYRVLVSADGGAEEEAAVTALPDAMLTGLARGPSVRVRVVAVDAAGNASEPSPPSEPIRVDATPPLVRIAQPQDGGVLFADAPVRVSCFDDNLRFCIVEFGATPDPTAWAPLTPQLTEPFDLAQIATIPIADLDGIYTLRVRAEDEAGGVTHSVVRFVVDSTPPQVVETGPTAQLLPSHDLATGRRDPAWSPTGDRIAFVSDEGGAQDVWVARSDGAEAYRITADAFVDAAPTWSPDGSRIAFASRRDAEWSLHVATMSGDVASVGLPPGADAIDPAWSPDGARLAFASDLDGDYELYVVENLDEALAGGDPITTQMTRNVSDDRRPAWRPGGDALAYEAARGFSWDIRSVDVATGEDRQLTASFDADLSPDYHPDGKQVLFTRVGLDGAASLHVHDLVSGDTRGLSTEGIEARYGVWSPSGRAVAFESAAEVAIAPLVPVTSRLEARIATPANGAFVGAETDIVGVARGPDMAFYRLEFAPADDTASWTTITGDASQPVTDSGFLGRWDTTSLLGEYRLRLTVVAEDGSADVSETRVHVRDGRPELAVISPGDGEETLEPSITVAGSATPGASVTLNGERIDASSAGLFELDHPVSPGENVLEFRVLDIAGEQVSTIRRVVRVTDALAIDITDPTPFAALATPYVHVSGVAPGAVTVAVDEYEVPVASDGGFSRVLAIDGESRAIRVDAVDRFGRRASVERLALYTPGLAAGRTDTSPPAVVEPEPPVGAVLDTGRFEFQARIVDDRGFDPDTLTLTFDGAELEPEDWRFDTETGVLLYDPNLQLDDGQHALVVAGADLVGNALLHGDLRVTVDTQPTVLALSGLVDDATDSAVRVVLTSNRPLASVLSLQARAPGQVVGLPLQVASTGTDAPYTYEAVTHFSAGKTLELTASVLSATGVRSDAVGAVAVATLSAVQPTVVTLPNGVAATFAPVEGDTVEQIVFRTQDGSDAARMVAQRRDILDRGMAFGGAGTATFVVETAADGAEPPAFELTAPSTTADSRAWFQWDEQGRRWEPLPGVGAADARSALAQVAGVYGLIDDTQPPVLVGADPPSREDLPLDRYFVEAEFLDIGSGVAGRGVTATLDGHPVTVDVAVDQNRGFVRYVPTNLQPGLHTLTLSVADRAGNVAVESFDYLTAEAFRFTAFRLAPNPIRGNSARAIFRLTQTADVRMGIYTADGRLVRSEELLDVVGDAFGGDGSRETFEWDLTNAAGNPVASGVYIVQLTARNADDTAIRVTDKWAVIR